MMHALLRDVRLALRSLLRAPRFTLTTAGMLALGIGVSVAMFSVLYGVALKSLPYPDADAVVNLRLQPIDRSQRASSSLTPQMALDVVRGADGLVAASAYLPNGATYLGADKPRPMAILSRVKLRRPTGARTLHRISPASAIRVACLV